MEASGCGTERSLVGARTQCGDRELVAEGREGIVVGRTWFYQAMVSKPPTPAVHLGRKIRTRCDSNLQEYTHVGDESVVVMGCAPTVPSSSRHPSPMLTSLTIRALGPQDTLCVSHKGTGDAFFDSILVER